MKKKLKSALAAVLAAAVSLSLAACGGGKSIDDMDERDFEKALEKVETMSEKEFEKKAEKLEETEKAETATAAETEAEEKKPEGFEPTKEILEAYIYSNKRQLGNTCFTFPLSVQELLDAGYEFTKGPETVVFENLNNDMPELIADGKRFNLDYRHTNNEKRQLISECNVSGLWEFYDFPQKDYLIYPKGVRRGMSVEELIEKWGEPTVNDIDKYIYREDYISDEFYKKYRNTGNEYTVSIDLKSNTVSMIHSDYTPSGSEMIGTDSNGKPLVMKSGDTDAEYSFKLPACLSDGKWVYEYGGEKYLAVWNEDADASKASFDYTDESVRATFSYKGDTHSEYWDYSCRINGSEVIVARRFYHDLFGYPCISLQYYDKDKNGYCLMFEVHRTDSDEPAPPEAAAALEDVIFSIAETITPVS